MPHPFPTVKSQVEVKKYFEASVVEECCASELLKQGSPCRRQSFLLTQKKLAVRYSAAFLEEGSSGFCCLCFGLQSVQLILTYQCRTLSEKAVKQGEKR